MHHTLQVNYIIMVKLNKNMAIELKLHKNNQQIISNINIKYIFFSYSICKFIEMGQLLCFDCSENLPLCGMTI